PGRFTVVSGIVEEVFRLESERRISNDGWYAKTQPIFPVARAEAELRSGKRQGGGLPVAGRKDPDRISWKKAALAGDRQRAATAAIRNRNKATPRKTSRKGAFHTR